MEGNRGRAAHFPLRQAGPSNEIPARRLRVVRFGGYDEFTATIPAAVKGVRVKALILCLCTWLAVTVGASAQTVTVAMCQIVCLDGDREGNFVRIENALREAAAAHADIACFPESSLLGWVNPDAHTRAATIPGTDSDRLCGLARRYRIHLCIGLDEKDGTNLYDAAVLIDDAGKLLLKHRKINNLPDVKGLMVPPYTDGHDIAVAETKFGKIGVLICADTFDDANLKRMAALKPALVLVPYGWVGDEAMWPHHGEGLAGVVRHAADAIGSPVVGTDPIGQVSHGCWAERYYGGFSVAYDASGRRLAGAADRDRDVKVFTIPLAPTPRPTPAP